MMVAPFIAKQCVECHGEQSPEKDLVLTTLEPDMKATASAARWAVVVKQLATGEMPPEGKPRPEAWLLDDAEKRKLDTREGVEAAVRRMLDDPKLDRPRIPRFFREYFGYAAATEVFKNDKKNPEHDPRVLIEDTHGSVRRECHWHDKQQQSNE